jgi:hypothetical protein
VQVKNAVFVTSKFGIIPLLTSEINCHGSVISTALQDYIKLMQVEYI